MMRFIAAIFSFIFTVLFIAIVYSIYVVIKNSIKPSSVNRTRSSDGHFVPKSQDLTCNRYGHHHENEAMEYGQRYVVHEDPEMGYVILNGVKRKLEDCKYL